MIVDIVDYAPFEGNRDSAFDNEFTRADLKIPLALLQSTQSGLVHEKLTFHKVVAVSFFILITNFNVKIEFIYDQLDKKDMLRLKLKTSSQIKILIF